MTTQSVLTQPRVHRYSHIKQLPDPPRKQDMLHRQTLSSIDGALTAHFADRDDVLVGGEGYLRRNADDTGDFVPDCVFVDGVEDPSAIIWRNGYVISEVGKPPSFVLEVASRSTGRRDYTVKRIGYAGYGVGEYWRFDHTGGKYHDAPLAGDLLVDGEYQSLEIVTEPDGRHWGYSEALGLELWWDNSRLRFRDPVSGEFLLTVEEHAARADSEALRANSEALRANSEALRADSAELELEVERAIRARAESEAEEAQTRAAQLEAELRRLKSD